MIGTKLAHYEILSRLGKGGMGEVFVARDSRLDRKVALKTLPPRLAADATALERFRREARAVAALNHPNIVTLHSVEEVEGVHFLTMELVEGRPLTELVGEDGLPAKEVLGLATQIADAVRAAHGRGVTHRDLKPANIMVDGEGRVKVLDFGLAKLQPGATPNDATLGREEGETLTEDGLVVGTVPYMSPEHLHGRAIGPASDVFSLGIVFYEMATGRRPFVGDSSAELISALLRDEPPPVSAIKSDVPEELVSIVHCCLAKRPADRYASAEPLFKELRSAKRALDSGTTFAASAASPGVAPPPRPVMVGRDAEREILARKLANAQQGRGGLLFVTGEAGIGKTRLAQELEDHARELGFLVLLGHCRDMEATQPYLPLIEQIEQAARSVSTTALRQALGENAPEVAKLMPELRHRFPDIPQPVTLPPDQERRYMLHGLSEFIERGARVQPMLLVYEDLHWADESTLLMLRHLAQRLAQMPVMVLGSYRDTELRPATPFAAVLQDLLRERLADEVVLGRLDRDQVTSMLAERAGREPPAELVETVFRQTEGNPFFVDELYRHLYDAGELFDREGEWRSGIHRHETDVPRSVGLVISNRLEQVSADCRRMLTAAAIAGRRFSYAVLVRIAGIDEDRLLDALDEADDAKLIEDASKGREARYAFVHQQFRQALVAELSLPRRQRLHLRVAEALEEIQGDDAGDNAAELAHHLYQAGAAADPERTLSYLMKAARDACERLAYEDSLRHLEAAEEILGDGSGAPRARLLLARATTLRGLARTDEALAAFAAALDAEPDEELRGDILLQRARLQLDLFRGADARRDLEELLAAAREREDRTAELELLLALGRAYYVLSLDDPQNHALAARETYEAAYRLAKELEDPTGMIRALLPTSWFNDYWHDYFPQAKANLLEAQELASKLQDPELSLDVATSSLRFAVSEDDVADLEEARRLLEARRDPIRLKEVYFLSMWRYWVFGAPERCVEVCDAGIALARQLGAAPVQYPTIKALALLDLGRFGAAWEALEDEVADDEHPFGRLMQQAGRAIYEAEIGDFDHAVPAAVEALAGADELQRVWLQTFLLDVLGLGALRSEAQAEVARAAIEGRDGARGFRLYPHLDAEILLSRGELEAALEAACETRARAEKRRLGRIALLAIEAEVRTLLALERYEEASTVARGGIETARGAGMRPVEWQLRSHLAVAAAALGDDGTAREERAAARELVREVAATIPDAGHRTAFERQGGVAALLAAADAGEKRS